MRVTHIALREENMKAEKKFKGVIDRIEGSLAVILLGEDQEDAIELPKAYLPEGSKEGDLLSFKLRLESRKTKDAKKEVEEMIAKLKNKS
jgi:hypothetical protein